MGEWISIAIRDVFSHTTTGEWGTPPTTSSSVPVLRSTNFTNDGKLDLEDVVFRNISSEKLRQKQIKKGDILVEKSGGGPKQPAGRVAYCDIDFSGTCSNFLEIARVPNRFDSKFISYLLLQLYKSGLVLKYQQQTTGIINFKFGEYQSEVVRIPADKLEQSKIVDVLSTIDQAIEQTEDLITKYRRIKTGLMQDLLTRGIDENGQLRDPAIHKFKPSPLGPIPEEWILSSLGKLSVRITSGSRGWAKYYTEEGSKFIRIGNLTREHVNLVLNDVQHVKPPPSSEGKRTSLEIGDLLISVTADLAIIGVVPDGLGEAYINQHIALVKLDKDQVNPWWIGNYLAGHIAQQLIATLNEAGAKAGLNLPTVAAIPVPIPSTREQNETCRILCQLDNMLKEQNIHLSKLQRLKTGLMQDLLTGKVSVAPLLDVNR